MKMCFFFSSSKRAECVRMMQTYPSTSAALVTYQEFKNCLVHTSNVPKGTCNVNEKIYAVYVPILCRTFLLVSCALNSTKSNSGFSKLECVKQGLSLPAQAWQEATLHTNKKSTKRRRQRKGRKTTETRKRNEKEELCWRRKENMILSFEVKILRGMRGRK